MIHHYYYLLLVWLSSTYIDIGCSVLSNEEHIYSTHTDAKLCSLNFERSYENNIELQCMPINFIKQFRIFLLV